MKALARWLFMETHRAELVALAKQCREAVDGKNDYMKFVAAGRTIGILDCLTVLDLLT